MGLTTSSYPNNGVDWASMSGNYSLRHIENIRLCWCYHEVVVKYCVPQKRILFNDCYYVCLHFKLRMWFIFSDLWTARDICGQAMGVTKTPPPPPGPLTSSSVLYCCDAFTAQKTNQTFRRPSSIIFPNLIFFFFFTELKLSKWLSY